MLLHIRGGGFVAILVHSLCGVGIRGDQRLCCATAVAPPLLLLLLGGDSLPLARWGLQHLMQRASFHQHNGSEIRGYTVTCAGSTIPYIWYSLGR